MSKKYIIAFVAILSLTCDGASNVCNIRPFLYGVKTAYKGGQGGFLNNLTIKQKAALVGFLSLPFTMKAGLVVGATAGILSGGVVGVNLAENNPSSIKGLMPLMYMFGLGGALGVAGSLAGIPASYRIYTALRNRMIRNADARVAEYLNTLESGQRVSMFNEIQAQQMGPEIMGEIFQGHAPSFRNFRCRLQDTQLEKGDEESL